MNALYQRLKELDHASFERLCFHLLKERHPNREIRRVEGASGDEGADSFAGDLDSGPIVWQAKAFPNGVGDAQKRQIKESLERALTRLNPRHWVLYLNVDMDIRAHRWWQRFKKSQAGNVEMDLWQASEIVAELAHRKALCDLFFPEAALSPSQLKALIMKTEACSESQLTAVTQETSEQLLERLTARDARFSYQLVVSPENAPVWEAPGAVFSLALGRTTINAFPRDSNALRIAPPEVKLTIKGTGVEKMRVFMETGRWQVLKAEELGEVESSIAVFDIARNPIQPGSLELRQRTPRTIVPVRLTFGRGTERVVYDYVPFTITRVGTKELELVSGGREPFILTVLFSESSPRLSLTERPGNYSVRAGYKWLCALSVFRKDRYFEMYDLSSESRLVSGEGEIDKNGGYLSKYIDFFKEGTELCDYYGVELYLGRPVTPKDADNFSFLRQLMTGGALDTGPIHGTLEKRGGEILFRDDVWCNGPRFFPLRRAAFLTLSSAWTAANVGMGRAAGGIGTG